MIVSLLSWSYRMTWYWVPCDRLPSLWNHARLIPSPEGGGNRTFTPDCIRQETGEIVLYCLRYSPPALSVHRVCQETLQMAAHPLTVVIRMYFAEPAVVDAFPTLMSGMIIKKITALHQSDRDVNALRAPSPMYLRGGNRYYDWYAVYVHRRRSYPNLK